MAEPYASTFAYLLSLGAGVRDIHDASTSDGWASRSAASPQFAARELARVEMHRASNCKLLEAFAAPARSILDVGCSTGALTVAMATSRRLAAESLVGIDPDDLSLAAADARAQGHGLAANRIEFRRVFSGETLPFADGKFDVVACVSVLEFVSTAGERRRLVAEMMRVTKVGGFLFLATPNPMRLRELHSRRWLGDVRRRSGFPWASPPWVLSSLLARSDRIPIDGWIFEQALDRVGLPRVPLPAWVAGSLALTRPWQKILVRKRLAAGANASRSSRIARPPR